MSSQMGRDVAVSSRFDFNIFSYESDWTVGAEWTLRKKDEDGLLEQGGAEKEKESGVLKMRASTTGVRVLLLFQREWAETDLDWRVCFQDVSLLYMSRISNLLFSVGVSSDFRSSLRPVRGMGLEVQYFS